MLNCSRCFVFFRFSYHLFCLLTHKHTATLHTLQQKTNRCRFVQNTQPKNKTHTNKLFYVVIRFLTGRGKPRGDECVKSVWISSCRDIRKFVYNLLPAFTNTNMCHQLSVTNKHTQTTLIVALESTNAPCYYQLELTSSQLYQTNGLHLQKQTNLVVTPLFLDAVSSSQYSSLTNKTKNVHFQNLFFFHYSHAVYFKTSFPVIFNHNKTNTNVVVLFTDRSQSRN